MATLRTPAALAAVAAGLVLAPAAQGKLPGSPVLFTGQTLASGQVVSSPDDHYELVMGGDGNLVEYVTNPHGTPRAVFSTGTGGNPGAYATLEPTGPLVVFSAAGAPLWSNNASATGCANLDLQTDGNLVLYNSNDTAYWAANTESHVMAPGDELVPGQIIFSPSGGDYVLTMEADGVLRLDDSVGRVWTVPDAGQPGAFAEMNADGEFELINPNSSIAWDSGTDTAGASMRLVASGALNVDDPSTGDVEWGSGTSDGSRTGLTGLNGGRTFVPCPAAPPPPPPPPPAPTPITPRQPVTGTTKAPVPIKLKRINVSIGVLWKFDRGVSWVSRASVARFPRDARLTVTCLGRRGCPQRTVTVHHHKRTRRAVFRAGAKHIRALFDHLIGRRFHVGDTVLFTVTEPHHRRAGQRAIIRFARKPLNKPLPRRR